MIKFTTTILCLQILAFSKLYTNEFSLPTIRRNKGWLFLDRMSVGVGQIDININATLIEANVPETTTHRVELGIIPDSLWEQEAAFKCSKPEI